MKNSDSMHSAHWLLTKVRLPPIFCEVQTWQATAVVFLSLVVVIQMFIVGAQFNWLFVDADQLVIADQANWISKGVIFEPNFYGQSYLFPMDAYLSSLLVLFGANPLHAVQLCTSLFYCAPFFMLTFLCRSQNALIILALSFLVLTIPFKFLIVAQMARAFTTITSIATISMIYCIRSSYDAKRKSPIFTSILLGFCIGSFTGALLLLPTIVLIKDIRKIMKAVAWISVGLIGAKLLGTFYHLNPEYIVHKQGPLHISFQNLGENFFNPSIREPLLKLLAPGIAITAFLLFERWHSKKSDLGSTLIAVVGLLGILAGMLSTQKIRDFVPVSPFFAVERMFIAIPFFFLIVLANHAHSSKGLLTKRKATNAKTWNNNKIMITFLVSTLAGLIVYLVNLNRFIVQNQSPFAGTPSPAQVKSISELKSRCDNLKTQHLTTRGVFIELQGRDDAIAYGCSSFRGIPIIQTEYERRTWLKRHYENSGFTAKPVVP